MTWTSGLLEKALKSAIEITDLLNLRQVLLSKSADDKSPVFSQSFLFA